MDSKLFRKDTMPSFRPDYKNGVLEMAVNKLETPLKMTAPSDDPRYPRYAGKMSDGRLVTDYKSHCANNVVDSKYGNGLRGFLQHNADALIQVSRQRQAERAGAHFYKAHTVIGPKVYQQCNEYECSFTTADDPDSIGIQRSEPVPVLFGTFSQPNMAAPASTNHAVTTVFEGGRNSPRGREFIPLADKPFNPRLSQYGSSG
jgi:hypothetical protein